MWPPVNRGLLLDALLLATILTLGAAVFNPSLLSTEDAASSPLFASADLQLDQAILDSILSWNTRLNLATPEAARQWVFDRNSPVGPQHWPEMVRTCDPALFPQSPIDVNSSSVVSEPNSTVALLYPKRPLRRTVALHAHGLEFHAAPGDDSEPAIRGSSLGADWGFDSGHVHLPSDHTVDGGSYPMELHLVHTHRGTDESPAVRQTMASHGPFTVVAVLFKEGRHNPALDPLIEAATRVHRARPSVAPRDLRAAALIDLRQLVPSGPNAGFWHYNGSLTTPPCLVHGHPVRWHIVRSISELSPDQLGAFRRVMPEQNNNRPVQPTAQRTIKLQPLQQQPTTQQPPASSATADKDAAHTDGKDGL